MSIIKVQFTCSVNGAFTEVRFTCEVQCSLAAVIGDEQRSSAILCAHASNCVEFGATADDVAGKRPLYRL